MSDIQKLKQLMQGASSKNDEHRVGNYAPVEGFPTIRIEDYSGKAKTFSLWRKRESGVGAFDEFVLVPAAALPMLNPPRERKEEPHNKAQTGAIKQGWFYDPTKDPSYIPGKPQTAAPFIESGPVVDISYNPVTRKAAGPRSGYYWTKNGEEHAGDKADFVPKGGYTENPATGEITHPEKGTLKPIPTARVDEAKWKAAGGTMTDDLLATDLRRKGYTFQVFNEPSQSPLPPKAQSSMRMETMEALQRVVLASRPGGKTDFTISEADREALGLKIDAAGRPMPKVRGEFNTKAPEVVAEKPEIKAPQIEKFLANADQPLQKNYAAASIAIFAMSAKTLNTEQSAQIIQSFRAAKLDLFADALQDFAGGKKTQRETAKALDAAMLAITATQEASRVAAHMGKFKEPPAPKHEEPPSRSRPVTLENQMERIGKRASGVDPAGIENRVRGKLEPLANSSEIQAKVTAGTLMMEPSVQEEMKRRTDSVLRANGINPDKPPQGMQDFVSGCVSEAIEKNAGKIKDREGLLAVAEAAAREAIAQATDGVKAKPEGLSCARPVQTVSMADSHGFKPRC